MTSAVQTENRLVLGTAQLGFSYGVANKTGQPDPEAAHSLVQTAWEKGVREFDTAPTYGASESVLGNILVGLGVADQARITSKFFFDQAQPLPKSVVPVVESSLERLKISRLHCLMMHSEEMLASWDSGLGEMLNDCLAARLVDHIGISVYTPERAVQALETKGITAIQIPCNLLDHRFEKQGIFDLAEKFSKKIYIRSVFLQGLLLMNTCDLPEEMAFAAPVLEKMTQLAFQANLSKPELTLGFVKTAYPEAKVIFGAETARQVLSNMEAWEKIVPKNVIVQARQLFKDTPIKILNPSLWTVSHHSNQIGFQKKDTERL